MANGRSQRTVLEEIDASEDITLNVTNHLLNTFTDLPLTPVSPDEELIQLRGRYRPSTAFQPAIEKTISECRRTPKKMVGKSPRKTPQKKTPSKTPSVSVRISPRKRLNLQDVAAFTNAISTMSPPPKNPRKRMKQETTKKLSNVDGTLQALSHSQLVNLIKTLTIKHPEIKESVEDEIPTPDLSPLEDKLNSLQRNVYRSIPSTRWESRRDSFCFKRANIHLQAFKKECMEQARLLIKNEQWDTALDYVLLAWRYVRTLPGWDNPGHNKVKIQCFKDLSSICWTAIQKVHLEQSEIVDMVDRLTLLTKDDDCLSPSLEYLKEKLVF